MSRRQATTEDKAAGCAVGGCALVYLIYLGLIVFALVCVVVILAKTAFG